MHTVYDIEATNANKAIKTFSSLGKSDFLSSNALSSHRSFFEILCEHARKKPKTIAYRFHKSDPADIDEITYQELLAKVEKLVASTQETIKQGDRVLLAMPSCVEFIVSFLACQALGAISIPVPPPSRNRVDTRLENILLDATPNYVFSLQSIVDGINEGEKSGLKSTKLIAVDSVLFEQQQVEVQKRIIRLSDTAFLQYTSGSTGEPKGVAISNRNLLDNSRLMDGQLPTNFEHVGLSWLPLFHDMGLIGGMLLPLYAGFPVSLLPPAAFMIQPMRWMQMVSEYQVTVTVGPNFALELCASKATSDTLQGINLSSLKVLFCGAEPIQASTLENFSKALESVGLDKSAICPVYGLAEATLMVSAKPVNTSYVTETFQRNSIGALGAQVSIVDTQDNALELVSCGVPVLPVSIVDPNTSLRLRDGLVGEVWVSGESIAEAGYWQRSEQTAEVFHNTIIGGATYAQYLKTGDLGFISNGQLYVTGRIKDLIIIRGKNIYPQDIERLASTVDNSLSAGLAAAFTVTENGSEKLVVVVEASRSGLKHLKQPEQLNEIIGKIQQAVGLEIGVSPDAIGVIKPNQLRRTSSGKVRRSANRDAWLQSEFKLLHDWRIKKANDNTPRVTLRTRADHENWIVKQLSDRCSIDQRDIALDQPFVNFGLDSLAAVQLVEALQRHSVYGEDLDITALWDYPTVGALVAYLCDEAESLKQDRPSSIDNNSTVVASSEMEDEIAKLRELLES